MSMTFAERKAEVLKKFYFRDRHSPPQIYNRYLYGSVFLFGILGAGRGYDEGNIAGSMAQVSFLDFSGLDDHTKSVSYLANLQSNIKSMVLLGSIGGAMIAMWALDRIGRIRTLQELCVIWIIGAALQVSSYSVDQLYVGRLIEGLAIGQTVVVGPCYLSEVAPKSIRGLCNCIFAGAVYIGSSVANFFNYATALHVSNDNRLQWVAPTALKILIAAAILFGTFFTTESPRWLVKQDRMDDAVLALAKLRNLPEEHPYVQSEISDVRLQLLFEETEAGSVTTMDAFRELFLVRSMRYRVLLGTSAQILGQWSFAGSITMYLPELAALVGIKGTQKIMFSGVLAVVKLTSAFFAAFFLIDFLGRKRSLYLGITIQTFATLYYATYLAICPHITETENDISGSDKKAGVSALVALFIAGIGWTFGWNSIQYLINSEMLPLRVRNIGTSIIMIVHFANQYGNSKALPSMIVTMTAYGTFYFASGVLFIGLFWAYFFLPEISGRSLESMEELFSLPWYLIGRRGAELCPDNSDVAHLVEQIEKASIVLLDTQNSNSSAFSEKRDGPGRVTSRLEVVNMGYDPKH